MATGLVVNQTTVYFGPSSTLYPSEGSSAGPNDTVTILWREGSWYYIDYPAGTKRKRMYIPTTAVTNISGTVTNYTANLQTRYVNTAGSTYWGPGTTYSSAGSVSLGEAVQYVYPQRENDYVLIEYSVSGGQKKRAWIYGNFLSTAPIQAKIMKDAINPSENLAIPGGHKDYPVGKGTPVYAVCDGMFTFGYYWGKYSASSPVTYISLGKGYKLVPDAGWKTAAGQTVPNYIEYGHLSALNGYTTPNYPDLCNNAQGCYYEDCYDPHKEIIATKHVNCGDLIGWSGNSGNCVSKTGGQGYHLHIEFK